MSESKQQETVIEPSSFRDSIATAEASGKRKYVYPKKVNGKYAKYRNLVSAVLLLMLFIFPFVSIGGRPFILLDIMNRQFYLFSFYFAPSDFYLVALGMVVSIVFVIVFTVIYGRIFCGWICPQTIFMEHVFRRIEYWIEGDRNKQIRLDKQDWNTEKITKRLTKWFVFAFISFVISLLLFSYVLGLGEIKALFTKFDDNINTWIVLLVFTGLFYFVFAWFREQVCTLVCPYGRLQSVLIDKDTINVAYDYKRGESTSGRAKWRKNEDRKTLGIGDCIDCDNCVVVCPTGIDIRNGSSQLECVNCTACMDACDEVMIKVGMPTGLIRYASVNMIENKTQFKFTPRIIAYTVVLLVLVSVLTSMLFIRSSVETKFLKEPQTTYVLEGKNVVDSYQFIFSNKTSETKKITVKVIEPSNATIKFIGYGNQFNIKGQETFKGSATISIPEDELKTSKIDVTIGVFDEKGIKIDDYTTTFAGPIKISF